MGEAHTGEPNLGISMLYLFRDIFYMLVVLGTTKYSLYYLPWWIVYIPYSIIMGTVGMGLWVLGHECGHGAFAPFKFQNDCIGYVLHSLLLVPYFSWQYSHSKHHKYTNHLIKGETLY